MIFSMIESCIAVIDSICTPSFSLCVKVLITMVVLACAVMHDSMVIVDTPY